MLYAEYSSFGILTDYDLGSSRLIHCTKICSHFTDHTYCTSKATGYEQSQQTLNVERTSYELRRIDTKIFSHFTYHTNCKTTGL